MGKGFPLPFPPPMGFLYFLKSFNLLMDPLCRWDSCFKIVFTDNGQRSVRRNSCPELLQIWWCTNLTINNERCLWGGCKKVKTLWPCDWTLTPPFKRFAKSFRAFDQMVEGIFDVSHPSLVPFSLRMKWRQCCRDTGKKQRLGVPMFVL